MIGDAVRSCIDLAKYAEYPQCGIFYAVDGALITRDFCQWAVSTETGRVFSDFDGFRLEHRDMWDEIIAIEYPSAAADFHDDHKAMPRGRVELASGAGQPLWFRVTLCPCLDTPGFRQQVLQAFRLQNQCVDWAFGAMNYICRDCRSRRLL